MNATATAWGETLPEIWKYCSERGFSVILRSGHVHLFHHGAPRHCLRRPIDRGQWMQDMPLLRQSHLYDVWPTDQPGEWVDCSTELDAKTVLEFRATARDCYCYQGVNRCDFCTGLRKPDRNSNEFGSIEAAQVALMSRGYQSENNSTHRFCKGDEWAAIYGGGSNAGLPTIYVVNTGTYN